MTERLNPDYLNPEYVLRCDCGNNNEFGNPPSPVEVIGYHSYKHKREERLSDAPAFSSPPEVHEKYNGYVIHDQNFPVADFVCPECGKRYQTENLAERNIDEDDLWDFEDISDNNNRVVQSVTVINELPDVRNMWRVTKGETQIGIAETREEAKRIVQDQYPIEMDLDWFDKDNRSICSVDHGDHTSESTKYTVKFTYE